GHNAGLSMPPHSRFGGLQACQIPSTRIHTPVLSFLYPLTFTSPSSTTQTRPGSKHHASQKANGALFHNAVQGVFFSALAQAASCHNNQEARPLLAAKLSTTNGKCPRSTEFSTSGAFEQKRGFGNE